MNNTETPITKGQDIMVRRSTSSRARRAYVLRDPYTIGRWTAVDFAFYKPGYTDTISQHDHVAIIGQDEVTVVR